jgi:hypothetical protein
MTETIYQRSQNWRQAREVATSRRFVARRHIAQQESFASSLPRVCGDRNGLPPGHARLVLRARATFRREVSSAGAIPARGSGSHRGRIVAESPRRCEDGRFQRSLITARCRAHQSVPCCLFTNKLGQHFAGDPTFREALRLSARRFTMGIGPQRLPAAPPSHGHLPHGHLENRRRAGCHGIHGIVRERQRRSHHRAVSVQR